MNTFENPHIYELLGKARRNRWDYLFEKYKVMEYNNCLSDPVLIVGKAELENFKAHTRKIRENRKGCAVACSKKPKNTGNQENNWIMMKKKKKLNKKPSKKLVHSKKDATDLLNWKSNIGGSRKGSVTCSNKPIYNRNRNNNQINEIKNKSNNKKPFKEPVHSKKNATGLKNQKNGRSNITYPVKPKKGCVNKKGGNLKIKKEEYVNGANTSIKEEEDKCQNTDSRKKRKLSQSMTPSVINKRARYTKPNKLNAICEDKDEQMTTNPISVKQIIEDWNSDSDCEIVDSSTFSEYANILDNEDRKDFKTMDGIKMTTSVDDFEANDISTYEEFVDTLNIKREDFNRINSIRMTKSMGDLKTKYKTSKEFMDTLDIKSEDLSSTNSKKMTKSMGDFDTENVTTSRKVMGTLNNIKREDLNGVSDRRITRSMSFIGKCKIETEAETKPREYISTSNNVENLNSTSNRKIRRNMSFIGKCKIETEAETKSSEYIGTSNNMSSIFSIEKQEPVVKKDCYVLLSNCHLPQLVDCKELLQKSHPILCKKNTRNCKKNKTNCKKDKRNCKKDKRNCKKDKRNCKKDKRNCKKDKRNCKKTPTTKTTMDKPIRETLPENLRFTKLLVEEEMKSDLAYKLQKRFESLNNPEIYQEWDSAVREELRKLHVRVSMEHLKEYIKYLAKTCFPMA